MVVFDNLVTSAMSEGFTESETYIWNTDNDYLGEGTFGKVYLGVHKRTGDKVAVKTFRCYPREVPKETKMLQSLKHQYIIQFHAIETEKNTENKVMVMELCNGGSLMNFLNEPENACGLLDSEFLLVFEHLSGGLEYLKKHNVIHRDVKPDNIMRHVFADGRVIYKLADFGTARELPEGQNFYSLHGTEPYLNPQLFKVCFFKDAEFRREFGANTDLWSIGVTLYQIATGTLPFMVQDRQVMLAIYNEMLQTQGIISAVQQRNSEEVVFQKKLPQTSRLSEGLKSLITPIIAGLFEQETNKQWSFTQYYERVLELLSRKVMSVFYVNKMQILKIYVKPDDTFNDFKAYVCQQSEVSEENQVFLYKQHLIVSSFDEFHSVGSECIYLFDRTATKVEYMSNTQLIYENVSSFPSKFRADSDCDDWRLAFVACRDLCVCKNLMDYQSTVYKHFTAFMNDFHAYCKEEQNEQRKMYDILLDKNCSINSRVKILVKLQDLSHSPDEEFTEKFKTVTDNFKEQAGKIFDDLADSRPETEVDTKHDSYLSIVVKELSDMKSMTKNLYNLKVYNKKEYEYEKIKIIRCVRTIMEILTDKIHPDFEAYVDDAKRWYKKEFFGQVRSLSVLKKHINRYRRDLNDFEADVDTRSNEKLEAISKTKQPTMDTHKLFGMLEQYKRNNCDMKSLIEENIQLAEKIGEFFLSLDTNMSTDL
ncbi:hypothetical protein Zmor_021610 [Zophobas morio]|uniref:Protein kinase domain-containing protein n=1 Tax=Zophobas morio TaxID=2755281 RepID=A0AA38I5I6_9CUCU|nr:hypothetical protein Zmor_021610 [Zophobas morio]